MIRFVQSDGISICESIPLDDGKMAILHKLIAQNEAILRANCTVMEEMTTTYALVDGESLADDILGDDIPMNPDIERMAKSFREIGRKLREELDSRVRDIIHNAPTPPENVEVKGNQPYKSGYNQC